jgi:hypothetical protein
MSILSPATMSRVDDRVSGIGTVPKKATKVTL